MSLRRAFIIVTVLALAAHAVPSLADAPTPAEKVVALKAAIANANAENKPVLQAMLQDAKAQSTAPSGSLAISRSEARADAITMYISGYNASTQANLTFFQDTANAASDCRNATQIVSSTSAASAFIENPHHMHIAQGFVALLPVFFMLFHKFPACDKPITITKLNLNSADAARITGMPSMEELLTSLNLPKQP